MKLSKHLKPCSPEWKFCTCYGCAETRSTVFQGVNDILLECEALQLPVELEQTGGMCMAVSLDIPASNRFFLFSLWGVQIYDKANPGEPLADFGASIPNGKTEADTARNIARWLNRSYWQAVGFNHAVEMLQKEEFTEHAELLSTVRTNLEHI